MPPPLAPTFAQAARWWFKLGMISFGGPAGQIATMHHELVGQRRWISPARFQHALAFCTVLPGPEAQQLATYIGWLLHGIPGGIVAGGLFILPAFFLLVGLSWAYAAYGNLPWLIAVFAGVKPAVVAVVAFAAWRIGKANLRGWAARVLALGSLVAAFGGVPFPAVVVSALSLGWIWPAIAQAGTHKNTGGDQGKYVIDDESPSPEHAQVHIGRIVAVTGTALALGLLPLGALSEPLREMASFFTGLALLTFGGAYAVLPYLHDGALAHGWLSAGQMMDGLALGETTPGPLILVVTFVGYLGSGVSGAAVATAYTFIPSFVFILCGAPFVERARAVPRLAGPLGAVAAAVVGVIAHLAWVLAAHAVMVNGRIDTFTVVVALASLVLLVRFSVGVTPVLAGAALLGWVRWLVG